MKFYEILTKTECDISKNRNFALSPLSMTEHQTENPGKIHRHNTQRSSYMIFLSNSVQGLGRNGFGRTDRWMDRQTSGDYMLALRGSILKVNIRTDGCTTDTRPWHLLYI